MYLISQVTTSNGQVCWTVKIQNENMAFKSHSGRVENQFQQIIKMTMVEMDNSRIIMSNLTTKSVPVFYFSFTSRAKLMVQERVGITVPEVSAWTDSHVGCHPRILWLVTFTSLLWRWQWPKCHQALFVRLPRSKAALIYILYLCLLCVQCGCACNIILPVEKMSTTKIECW